ncbi:MAG: GNAT family N-acetyltransferase [Arcticibacter sp.]
MQYSFRPAREQDLDQIWGILKDAITRRKEEGSNQWQDGYPNPEVVRADIAKDSGYVLTDGDTIVGYCAILINDEPEYANLRGKWLTEGDFVLYHRVAVSDKYLGQGLAQEMLKRVEEYAREHGIRSVKADTNFDNLGMLRIFEKLGYTYCGEVSFRGSSRKAFEKVLVD